MTITVVTTFSDSGYHEYGRTFLKTFNQHVSPTVGLVIYKDDIADRDILDLCPRSTVYNLEPTIPALTVFKERNAYREIQPVKFQYQSVRFSHKVYALYHAAVTCKTRYLIWLDSDTEFYSDVDHEYFFRFLPERKFVSFLGRRDGKFSECGFMMYDLQHPYAKEFFETFKSYYDNDELYNLKEWHDSFIFDVIRMKMEDEGKIDNYNLSSHVNKHHFNATFDGYIMHLKGDRKGKREKMLEKALRRKGEKAKEMAKW